jgi:hypothetical protein
MRVCILGAALLVVGIAVFCFCPGNVFGPEYVAVQTPEGPVDIKQEAASDWWVGLGSALCLAGWLVWLVGGSDRGEKGSG